MPRFRFRLETLRRLRQATRDELRVRLAEAYQAQQILADQQAAMASVAATLADARRRLLASGPLNVTRVVEMQRYQLLLEAQSRKLDEQAGQLAEEVDLRRQALVEADRQVRVLEKLYERRQRQHADAERAREAKRLDEIAANRWEASRR
jgi:flagellar FliJ protein